MVDIINLLLLIVACALFLRIFMWERKRIVLVMRLKRLAKELGGELYFLRCPFLPMSTRSKNPDVSIRILDTVYLIRLYSGGNKYSMVHFASDVFSVRYMKMSFRRLTSARRRATGIAFAESDKAFTVKAKVYVSRPMEIPSEFDEKAYRTEKILLFNPAPHAVSYVSDEKTSIKVAAIGDEMHGMKVFTGSSFVAYADRQSRKGDY